MDNDRSHQESESETEDSVGNVVAFMWSRGVIRFVVIGSYRRLGDVSPRLVRACFL